ncbi:VOC family protein [uncultured Pseudomonas sp.]|uniref:VOC family protein n=1 Tax=uncultured Pseudomonas sp. TaxID=114707 RepID=UPI0025DC6919|nr:VOC family protein [uncultured Pseudomonas sp.]
MMALAQRRFGIDHPLVSVRDHAAALANYRRLGFAPSPVSYHPWGTVTSLMMFPSNFIELIGVADPAKFGTGAVDGFCFGRRLGEFLAREEGVSLVALHSTDCDGDHAELVARGLASQGRIDFRRAMRLPDGSPGEAVVSLGLFLDDELPDVSNFICHQHRPELIWVPGWQQHPNGALGIAALTYVAADPERLVARWRLIYGEEAVGQVAGVLQVDSGCGLLRVLTPEQATAEYGAVGLPQARAERPHAIAIRVTVASLARVHEVLAAGGLAGVERGDCLQVAPEHCGNVILEFAER